MKKGRLPGPVMFVMIWTLLAALASFAAAGNTAGMKNETDISIQTLARELCLDQFAGAADEADVSGYGSKIPFGAKFTDVEVIENETAKVTIQFPGDSLEPGMIPEKTLSEIGYQFSRALEALGIFNVYMYAADPASDRIYGFDELVIPEIGNPPVQDEGEDGPRVSPENAALNSSVNPIVNPGNIQGSLTGKTIYLNQGHGWFDDVDFGRWRVQRGIVEDYGILEDFSNAEQINIFTVPYLVNAGATVLTVREMDHQTKMVIVDEGDGISNPSNGTYEETGSWFASTLRGFKQKTGASWVGVSVNPFDSGGINRLANVDAGGVTATARWTPNMPAAGYYWVYASWSRYSGRSTQAKYIVHHSGGDTTVVVDQTRFGFIWYPLGRFYFEAGYNAANGSVELVNHTGTGATVSADAIRFGGGMGDMERHTHGISGRPRFEEEAVNYLQWNGFGSSGFLYTGEDDESGGWSDRPQFAQWLSAYDTGQYAYLAHHTNCCTYSGTRTYINSNASADSITLRDYIHDEIVNDIRAGWDAAWTAYKNSGNYSENSQTNLGSVPGFLLETLFHDSASDCSYYRDPRFRMIIGRAIGQGFIKYFAYKNGAPVVLPPEVPTNLRVKNLGGGQVEVAWNAPPFNTGDNLLGDAA
ncbi:MAG TPA: hypothetical protein PLB62_13710, partial [Candidatus Sumerlaeota bacterium]|nr:hypothetical protein [Candidatus Sumerlaeota bacterium]